VTLGEAIRVAHETAVAAERERNRLLAVARGEGVTVAELGALMGVASMTAWRWSGGHGAYPRVKSGALEHEVDDVPLRGMLRAVTQDETPAPSGPAGGSANKG